MSSVTRSQVSAIFRTEELFNFLTSKNVSLQELLPLFDNGLLQHFLQTVSKSDLKREASQKAIKNYSMVTKAELIKKLWTHTEPVLDRSNLKRIKTINTKKQILQSEKKNEDQSFMCVDENVPVCIVCKCAYDVFKCSETFMYCEKLRTYDSNRTENTVYDSYYNDAILVDPSVSNKHYSEIESARQFIRETANNYNPMNGPCKLDFHVKSVAQYYPSLLTDKQIEYLTPGAVRLIVDQLPYIPLKQHAIKEFENEDRCSLCNEQFETDKCSEQYLYCDTKRLYYNTRVRNEVYDSFYDIYLPVSDECSALHYIEIESKRKSIREEIVDFTRSSNQIFEKIRDRVFRVADYYPSLMTTKHEEFIRDVKYACVKLEKVKRKFTVEDFEDLLVLNNV